MFNHISPTYDRVNRLISFGLDSHWRKFVASRLPSYHFELLDLATGTGEQISALLHLSHLKNAIGIDQSDRMIKIAQEKHANFSHIKYLKADILDLPFPNQTFDVCTLSFGIRNVFQPKAAFKEIYRVTRPGGRVLVLEFARPTNWFRPFHWVYLKYCLPWIGKIFSHDRAAYRYLYQTIESFASPQQLQLWMQESGWKNVHVTKLCMGAVILYEGTA
jgi:demethylmenaquinone methyltransferase / 2-methoxy-6-polyprenyl-1,4-benzoquinol methylase